MKDNKIMNIPYDKLINRFHWSFGLLIALLTLLIIAIVTGYTIPMWGVWAWLVLLVVGIVVLGETMYNLGQQELFYNYDELVVSRLNEKGEKEIMFLSNTENLADLYEEFGNNKKSNELQKLEAQHLIDSKIIQGFQRKNNCISGAYYLLTNDNQLFWSDDLNAVLTFSSKDSAQAYVNEHIKDFDGKIMNLPIALDGEVKTEDNKEVITD